MRTEKPGTQPSPPHGCLMGNEPSNENLDEVMDEVREQAHQILEDVTEEPEEFRPHDVHEGHEAEDGREGAISEPRGRTGFEQFDRYIEEHGIPEEHYRAAFALWIAEEQPDSDLLEGVDL